MEHELLSQGRVQDIINALLKATPEQPVRLPIAPIKTELIIPRETQNTLLTVAAVLGAAAILTAFILTKNQRK